MSSEGLEGRAGVRRCFKITLAYDGTAYAGWQSQPRGPTIQQALEAAWHRITGSRVRMIASGRTDAGVHALGQVVGVHSATRLDPPVLARALNANLPGDLVVLAVEEVALNFHPIRDARSKRYGYLIGDGPLRPVFGRRQLWHVRQELDERAMHQAAQRLRGRHEFASFQAAGSPRASSERSVVEIRVDRWRGWDEAARTAWHPLATLAAFPARSLIAVEVEADGFLYHMVRNIVGSLVAVGRAERDADWLQSVLEARDRRLAGSTAPPHGLYLVRVTY